MAYREFEDESLNTGLADAPVVQVVNQPDGNPTGLSIEFPSAFENARRTLLEFTNVFYYSWADSFVTNAICNTADYAFAVIEVLDSAIIRRIVETSPYSDEPRGDRLGGVLNEDDLHHYRVAFDDHGAYDVVCTDMHHTTRTPGKSGQPTRK